MSEDMRYGYFFIIIRRSCPRSSCELPRSSHDLKDADIVFYIFKTFWILEIQVGFYVVVCIENVLRKPADRIFEPQHDKTNRVTAHPAKTQISLGIRPV